MTNLMNGLKPWSMTPQVIVQHPNANFMSFNAQTSQKCEQIVFELVSETIKNNMKSCIYVFTFLTNAIGLCLTCYCILFLKENWNNLKKMENKIMKMKNENLLKIYSHSGHAKHDFVSSSEQILWLKTSQVVYCTWLQSINECLVKWRDVCL